MFHLLLSGLVLLPAIYDTQSEIIETCPGEDFSASCDGDRILLVTSAEYGRREMGRCINKEQPHMGCTTDALPLLDRWCSGRDMCEVQVTNQELEEINRSSKNPCLEYLKMYLKVEYHCINVETHCQPGPNIIRKDEGFLSSHVTDTTGCGSPRSPWKISVNQGKTIDMTLIDFKGEESVRTNYATCVHAYGYILEKPLGINHTICGGQERKRLFYSSKTNSVDVHLRARSGANRPYFLVKFQASGCSDLHRPENSWYKREGNEAVIGCETNGKEWRLTCTGNTWHGYMGNCSKTGSELVVMIPEEDSDTHIGFKSVIIMTSMTCSVFIAVVVAVMCGVIYLKKYRMKQETKRLETTYSTMEKQHQSYYRPADENSINIAHATDAPSERLVDVPGTWVQPDTFGRHGTMTSYPDQRMCPTLPGARA